MPPSGLMPDGGTRPGTTDVTRFEVELYTESIAVIVVEADVKTSKRELRELALQKIDSGEAHWQVDGYTMVQQLSDD